MKALSTIAALLLAALASACTTTGVIEGKATARGEGKLTSAYVRAVEHQAKKYSMQVYWINPPTDEALQRYVGENGL